MVEIKTGDVVTLKSGGPPMTVGQIAGITVSDEADDMADGECICAWFATCHGGGSYVTTNKGEPLYGAAQSGKFHVDMLCKVETSPDELRAAALDVYTHLNDEGGLPRGAGLRTRLGRALGVPT